MATEVMAANDANLTLSEHYSCKKSGFCQTKTAKMCRVVWPFAIGRVFLLVLEGIEEEVPFLRRDEIIRREGMITG